MRHFAIGMTAAAVLAMTGCGQKQEAQGEPAAPVGAGSAAGEDAAAASAAPAGFPKMTASYRAAYQLSSSGDAPTSVNMEVAGAKKLRFEQPHMDAAKAAAGMKMIGVFDDAANRYLVYLEGPEAPHTAMVMPFETNAFDIFRSWEDADGAKPQKVGSEKIAGLSCDVWTTASDDSGRPASEACVTRDGVMLRSGEAGAAPDMIATSVDKGPIDPARFAVPEGYEIIDMAPCQSAMQDAMAAAQAGRQPDMGAMQKCQAMSEKAAAMFGQ